MLKSKFYGITFPFFGLKDKAENISVSLNSIEIERRGKSIVIDRFTSNSTFIDRYLTSTGKPVFAYTCLDLTALLNTQRCNSGIDSLGKIFDLSYKQKFKCLTLNITKYTNKYIWLQSISYPFRIPAGMFDEDLLKTQKVQVVNIDGVWTVYKFTYFYFPEQEIKL